MIPGERLPHSRTGCARHDCRGQRQPAWPANIHIRTHRDFLRRLLENEVHNIYHGVVEIRLSTPASPASAPSVACRPPRRGIDPVGSLCWHPRRAHSGHPCANCTTRKLMSLRVEPRPGFVHRQGHPGAGVGVNTSATNPAQAKPPRWWCPKINSAWLSVATARMRVWPPIDRLAHRIKSLSEPRRYRLSPAARGRTGPAG